MHNEVFLLAGGYRSSAFLVMVLFFASCSNHTFGSRITSQSSAVEIADATIKKIESDPLFLQIRTDLEQRDVELTSPGISRIAWLSAAPGVGYRVGGYWMNVHLYPDVAAAKENAARIPEGADSGMMDWVAPPHFFRCNRIILYLGQDQKVTTALTELCGPRFAGFRRE